MRCGNHCLTVVGMIGCMMATPTDMIIVVAKRTAYPLLKPRRADPRATMNSPPTSAPLTPRRATSSEPPNAATANSAGGMLLSKPTSVALRENSSRIIAITGGTARIVSLKPLPASHSSTIATHVCRATYVCSRASMARVIEPRTDAAMRQAMRRIRCRRSCRRGWVAATENILARPPAPLPRSTCRCVPGCSS